jgi:isocitrate/isopropylmalate dehydrogenase
MLDWFHSPAARRGAQMIYQAVRRVFSDRKSRTRDMGGSLSTTGMGDVIIAALPTQ